MTTYVYRPTHPEADQFGFIEKTLDYLSTNSSAYYIPDEMAPTAHMCSGKLFTSKKKFRNETKAYGCIEVGNDYSRKGKSMVKLDRRERRDHIKQAIYELKNNGRS